MKKIILSIILVCATVAVCFIPSNPVFAVQASQTPTTQIVMAAIRNPITFNLNQ